MIFKDTEMLAEAYTTVLEKKCTCKHAAKGCKCNNCKDCKCNQKKKNLKEAAKEKPDYLDVDEDGDKKESIKKALSDKGEKKEVKEEATEFTNLYRQIMEEEERSPFGPSVF